MADIRKARTADVEQIAKIINSHADLGDMLHRTQEDLYEVVRDFFVAAQDGEVVGCAALHVMGEDLAELRSLGVVEEAQGLGLGKRLVAACAQEAPSLGVSRVFALTAKPGFFERLGFRRVPRSTFPQKIWRDCFNCRFFESCGEVAVCYDVPDPHDLQAAAERVLLAEGEG